MKKSLLIALVVAGAVLAIVLWVIAREDARTSSEVSEAVRTSSPARSASSRAIPPSAAAAAASGTPGRVRSATISAEEHRAADAAAAAAAARAREHGGGSTASPPASPSEAAAHESAAPKKYAVNRDGIREGIRSIVPALKDCYTSWLQLTPNVAGKIVVKFRIAPAEDDPRRGIIVDAKMAESQLEHEILEGCILNAMQDVEFQDPPAEGMDVTYPLTFSNDEDGGPGAPPGDAG